MSYNDELKTLADTVAALAKSVTTTLTPATRKTESDIIRQELSSLLRSEIPSVIEQAFGITHGQGAARPAQPGINVIINNNTSNTVSAREVPGMDEQKYLEITIDQMVANSLLQGRQTSGVLRSLFGIVPDLIGR